MVDIPLPRADNSYVLTPCNGRALRDCGVEPQGYGLRVGGAGTSTPDPSSPQCSNSRPRVLGER